MQILATPQIGPISAVAAYQLTASTAPCPPPPTDMRIQRILLRCFADARAARSRLPVDVRTGFVPVYSEPFNHFYLRLLFAAMAARHLINENGEPFAEKELEALAKELDALNRAEREDYRNRNANAIAQHAAKHILIVAGPGTGKSTIFKQRALFWLRQYPAAQILALSFVRKLVADLNSDIQNDEGLTGEQKRQVDVHTLHKYARSVVEQNHGTAEWKFSPHFRIIGQTWKDVVWHDVLLLSEQEPGSYKRKDFEKQIHEDAFDGFPDWQELKTTYFTLCRYYNAAGFSDLILRAKDALAENPPLNQHHYFIIDEYQDFNASEERLLEQITGSASGRLTVGDDDQVLYETLKSGKASLIRAIYANTSVVNAMLAFCGRCDFHITKAASHFIKLRGDPETISKIYLPISEETGSKKVQVVGCATPTTAVDYIRKFVEDHKSGIEQRRVDLASGTSKDAYLLILSPSGTVNFYKPNGARDELLELIRPYSERAEEFSEDYYMVLNYYSLASYPTNNFTFRKVLHYERVSDAAFLPLLKVGIQEGKALCSMETECIKNALAKAAKVREIIDSKSTAEEKAKLLAKHVDISDLKRLRADLEKNAIGKEQAEAIEHQEEDDAELEEIKVKRMCAIELMTIVGSKGLSADHVIIIGFDSVNLAWVTKNAFFVAMTRARKSLHLITCLKAGGATLPHEFLDQLPDRHLEFRRYTKKERASAPCNDRNSFIGYLRYLVAQGRR